MNVIDIKTFIPSKDFDISVNFYQEFGFTASPANEDLMLFEAGDCAFFLQRFYHQAFAENLMMQLCVDDIDIAYQRARMLKDKQKITPITQEAWGKVFFLWGPSGELWQMTQLNEDS